MASQTPLNEEDDLLDDSEQDDLDDETLEADEEPVAASPAKSDVTMDEFSIAARQRLREELNAQVEAFLARGGKINEIPPTFSADPPKKPTSDYGGRPI
jgi:hypothetical protein